MKKSNIRITAEFLTLFLLCGTSEYLFPANLLNTSKFFVPDRDEREEELNQLREEYEKFKKSTEEELKTIQEKLTHLNQIITAFKAELKEKDAAEQEFLSHKISLLNEQYQALFNQQLVLKSISSLYEQRIKLLEEYKKDPHSSGLALEQRAVYSYDALQNAIKKLFEQEEKLKTLSMQKGDATTELENLKKKHLAAVKNLQSKKKEQEEYVDKGAAKIHDSLKFKERGELLDLEEKLAEYQQELAALRVRETSLKIAVFNTNLFIENEKFKVIKNNVSRVKAGLRISEMEVQEARERFEKFKQKIIAAKEAHYDEIKQLSALREKLKEELQVIGKRYKMPVMEKEEFLTWSVDTPTVDTYTALAEMGYKHVQIQLVDKKIEYLRTQIQSEDIQLKRNEIKNEVLNTWYEYLQRKNISPEHIVEALRQFKEYEAEVSREINTFHDRKNALSTSLSTHNKELTNLHTLVKEIEQEREVLFKRYPMRYNAALMRLAEAEKIISEQIDIINKLIEMYTAAYNDLTSMSKEINIIISELETKSIWQRSQYAISWRGLRDFFPNLYRFAVDFTMLGVHYIQGFTWQSFRENVTLGFALGFLALFIGIIMLFVLLRMWLPLFAKYLASLEIEGSFFKVLLSLAVCCISAINAYLWAIIAWLVIFFLVYFEYTAVLFPRVLFYLLSIPYLLYISRRCVRFIIRCNRERNYAIFDASFERRFSVISLLFLWVTIIVYCLREAFLLVTMREGEFANILLAIHSITLRMLIIFAIGRDELVEFIGQRGVVSQFIASLIRRYYYPLLFGIMILMILSDPYVGGYRNLVSYVLWGVLGTFILFRLLYSIHTYIKEYSEVIFFSTEEEIKKERFASAKTWYGITVIVLFLLFIVIGIAIGIHLWGLQVGMEDVWKVIDVHLFSTGVEQGETVWFTPRKFLVIVSFIIAGFLAAVAFNRFVLQRIFDILPVDLGIQNMVLSITRYLIFAIAIYLGFQWAGLGNLLLVLGIAVGSIGYMSKEAVGDFISYFILLVQRPIQIGDYIMLSQDVQGVVRKVTPRSVILRRKDSYTIIVPNSMFLTHPINNWSYARNFVAFDDIYLTVSYGADPVKVRKLILRVLEESTDVLKSPRPIIRLHEFGEYGFIFMVRGFISSINILRRWDIASDIRFNVIRSLAEEGIKLAIPSRIILRDETAITKQ